MLKLLVPGVLPAVLTGTLLGVCALPLAHADIYTWTDETGRVNLSNLTPPDGARVTRVYRESAQKVAPPGEDLARDTLRDAEVRLLAERVRQLQDEVDGAKRQAVREADYRMMPAPAPPLIQYIQAALPPAQYDVAPQPAYGGCDFGSLDCGFGWGSGFYPGYIVVNQVPFRRGHPGRGDNPIAPRPPIHGGGGPGHIAPWLPIVGPGTGRGR